MFVAVHVKTGTITSSQRLRFEQIYAKCNASVPEPTAMQLDLFVN